MGSRALSGAPNLSKVGEFWKSSQKMFPEKRTVF
jgi:hypothetical protein